MRSLPKTSVRSTSVVGLDIGSGGVRATELAHGRRGLTLRRYGQVGLPVGAVVDGEIVQPGTVVTAIRRLWTEAGFSTRNVVTAVSGQRVIVRQAEVARMSEGDFRSALAFQAADLIPIPVDDALLDFMILPPQPGEEKRTDAMRILLAAAHRSLVESHMALLREASLRVLAVDAAPIALVRALGRSGQAGDAPVALVDIGADVTIITVREHGTTRFSRILNAGGSDLTTQVAERLGVAHEYAESMKRHAATIGGGPGALRADEVDSLVSDIENSLTFFASQLSGERMSAVYLTGGPAASPELVAELTRRLPVPVTVLDALAGIEMPEDYLDEGARRAAGRGALTSIGAAEWSAEPSGQRLSLLPKEVAEAAALRRKLALAGAGVGLVAVALAGLSYQRVNEVDTQKAATAAAVARANVESGEISSLSYATAEQTAIEGRISTLQSLDTDNIAWPALLNEIASALPPGTKLTSLSFSDSTPGVSATATPTASANAGVGGNAPAGAVGQVSMAVTAPGSPKFLDNVAVWLRALSTVRGLASVWVPSATSAGNTTTFQSSGWITPAAPHVVRTDIPTGAGS